MPTSDRSARRTRTARVAKRTVAAGAALGMLSTAVVLGSGGVAGAAVPPRAQSVGRFLDGAVGGNAIQTLADLKDARAVAPGTPSQRNPLSATLLGRATVPLGHHLQLPGGGVFKLGAVNQVAVARNNGFAFGASGAVSNSGGISAGGSNSSYPADARIDLSSKALGQVRIPGLPKLPGAPKVPGMPNAAALGGISADIGAISGLVQTNVGGKFARPKYKIASLTLTLSSPALAAVLAQLQKGGGQLTPLLDQLYSALQTLKVAVPRSCRLEPAGKLTSLTLDHGAVLVDPSSGSITIDLQKLLAQAGAQLNNLPPNTDLLAYVLNNLGRILSKGLAGVINNIVDPITRLFANCGNDVAGELPSPLDSVVKGLLKQLKSGRKQLESALEGIAAQLSAAGAPGLKQLTDQLSQAIAIGVNVQQGAFPLGNEPSPKYLYRTPLKATPDQATGVVIGSGVERALEIDIAGSQGASLALGNASAGPSYIPSPPTSAPAAPPAPPTAIPTGIPAGEAADNGGASPLPLIVLLVVLGMGGAAALAYRGRGRFSR